MANVIFTEDTPDPGLTLAVESYRLAIVTVTDLTGAEVRPVLARISKCQIFAKDYAPILITFTMDTRYMPDVPQVFARTDDDATRIVEAVGELYASLYHGHVAGMRAELDAEEW